MNQIIKPTNKEEFVESRLLNPLRVSNDWGNQLSGVSRMASRMSRDWRIASGLVPLRWHVPRRAHGRNWAGPDPAAHMSLCASIIPSGMDRTTTIEVGECTSYKRKYRHSARKDGRMQRRCLGGYHTTKSQRLLCSCQQRCWPERVYSPSDAIQCCRTSLIGLGQNNVPHTQTCQGEGNDNATGKGGSYAYGERLAKLSAE